MENVNKKERIGIIFGGISSEYDISLLSAEALIENIDRRRHQIICIGVTREGVWKITEASPADIAADRWQKDATTVRMEEALSGIDFCFPIIHGGYGEDGKLQGLLELFGLPYAGSGVHSSALAMDKISSKRIFLACGIPTSDFLEVVAEELDQDMEGVCQRCEDQLGFPMFVKPANTGSSIGIAKVRTRQELAAAMQDAAHYDYRIIVEENIDGRELETAVIGNLSPRAASVGEIVPVNDFYDYEAKYQTDSGTQILIPADIPDDLAEEIRSLAVQAYRATDCMGFARVDFLVDTGTGKVYVNEINSIPGFTQFSMFPSLWAEKGLPFPELIEQIIEYGKEAYRIRHPE